MTNIPPPHLSGTPPTPRYVKRANAALALSVAAWSIFALSFVFFAATNKGKQTPLIVPLVGWRMDLEMIAGVSLLVSGLFGFIAILLGMSGRRAQVGKIAGIAGGVQFALWLLFVVTSLILTARD